MTAAAVSVGAAVALTACAQAPKPLYYWGTFPSTAYDTLRGDEKGPLDQLHAMDEQAEKAKAAGLPLPPGFHAHLGLVYLKLGRQDDARRAWQTERERFPESAVYIDSLMKRLDNQKS
ncbi:MAG: DUF4810 domain-containing protein [Burkholderiales bacterium]|nr:DUF4810 domain-containing protein [Burkholderiales bacterium]